MNKNFLYLSLVGLLFVKCTSNKKAIFSKLSPENTGVVFTNTVVNNDTMNIFNYRNFYNGAGVAAGDVNNDGLADIYAVSNQGPNKLFLNKGGLKFEDISDKSGISGSHAFSTGAVMADINGDGFLDIYVCNSGEAPNDSRANELFINNGNLTFTESAEKYGLADKGYSTHAAFFDYDVDGDLDMFLLENSSFPVNKLGFKNIRDQRDSLAGQKLFKNVEGHFEDVSQEAGIYGSLIGFGLGITIGDVNNDHWPDIYISNDFFERDYLYINQKNGSFLEKSKEMMGHISYSSMGADVADINNDGNLDIFSTDMLPFDDSRLKTTMVYEDYHLTNIKLENDFYHQYSRNMLQLNNGDNTFSEVGCLAGVHATDWSWGALIFDMDLDGQKDLFVANGIYKNVTDQDFVQFLNEDATMKPYADGLKRFNYKDFMDQMSVTPIANYAFRNNGDLNFENKANEWGLGEGTFTSGAAYADLDNDGDLELMLNNTNQPFDIFKNNSVEKLKHNFVSIDLNGPEKNKNGIGARVELYNKGGKQVLEQMPNRGFESSVDYILTFGLGTETRVDSLVLYWPNQTKETIKNPQINKTLKLSSQNAKSFNLNEPLKNKLFLAEDLPFEHIENYFIDFDRDGLLKQMYSRQGPGLTVADLNNDGKEDAVLGGASGQASKILIQNGNRWLERLIQLPLPVDVVNIITFDADNDKDLDLYFITGGNDNLNGDRNLNDYLFLNDGLANFTLKALPEMYQSGSSAAVLDIENDGDKDLFVVGRLEPMQYGLAPKHYWLVNDGKGNFNTKTESGLNMITDVATADINKDSYLDLVFSEDWGGIHIWTNNKRGGFEKTEIENTKGWWNKLHISDIDADGDLDIIAGNMGLNHRLKPTIKNPTTLWAGDFDRNLRIDHIISCESENGKAYPMVLKTDLQKQIPAIKKKFVYFKDFGSKKIDEIFGSKELENAVKREVSNSQTGIIRNKNGKFSFEPLPVEAQYSPIYGIVTDDFNKDGKIDLFLTGNFYDNQTELGRYDSNYGQLWLQEKNGTFKHHKSTLPISGQIRNSTKIIFNNKKGILLAKNSAKSQLLTY